MTKQHIAKLIIMGGLGFVSLCLMLILGNDYAIVVFISIFAILSDYDIVSFVNVKEDRKKLYCIADIILITSVVSINILCILVSINQVILYASISLMFMLYAVMIQLKVINFSEILEMKTKELLFIVIGTMIVEIDIIKFIFNFCIRVN